MSPEENEAFVRHYLEEVYRDNLDILDEIISADYDDHATPPPPGMTPAED